MKEYYVWPIKGRLMISRSKPNADYTMVLIPTPVVLRFMRINEQYEQMQRYLAGAVDEDTLDRWETDGGLHT